MYINFTYFILTTHYISMVMRQNLITTSFQMFMRDKQFIDIPSHFNVFGLDKIRI